MKTKIAIIGSILISATAVPMVASAAGFNYSGQVGTTTGMSSPDKKATNTLGRTGAASQASKIVDTTKNTKYINIECGETVVFTNGKEQFAWKFDVMGHQVVQLAKIAPAGFSESALKIYVDKNDLERS